MSEASRDRLLYVSFGLVLSLKLEDVEKVRAYLQENGAKIIFQTVSSGQLYVLREYQVQRALQGDLSQMQDVHDRKQKERSVKK